METNPKLRPTILARLLDTFSQIRSSRVCSCALWILSEYCTTPQDIHAALEVRPLHRLSAQSSAVLCLKENTNLAALCHSRGEGAVDHWVL